MRYQSLVCALSVCLQNILYLFFLKTILMSNIEFNRNEDKMNILLSHLKQKADKVHEGGGKRKLRHNMQTANSLRGKE